MKKSLERRIFNVKALKEGLSLWSCKGYSIPVRIFNHGRENLSGSLKIQSSNDKTHILCTSAVFDEGDELRLEEIKGNNRNIGIWEVIVTAVGEPKKSNCIYEVEERLHKKMQK